MPSSPNELIDRPDRPDVPSAGATDILADLLGSLRLSTLIYGRLELGAPWGLRFPRHPDAACLYVVGRGAAQLAVEVEPVSPAASSCPGDSPSTGGPAAPILLGAGDVALLPNPGSHTLRDGEGSPLHVLGEGQCRGSSAAQPIRLGGDGPRTMLVAGAFRFGSTMRTPLFETLPPIIHISASDPEAAPWLSATVQLIIAESASPSPGSTVIISRLVDVLLVQALRSFIARKPCQEHGLRALGDPQIGRALQLIHAHLAHPFTVESLATAVGLSRSGFAARFSDLVRLAPLEYIARWRMTRAAELLRESDLPMMAVAERVGYGSEAAFNRAFKRWQGAAPATYRRQQLAATARIQ
jgi:AraC-like DNA-binding protein